MYVCIRFILSPQSLISSLNISLNNRNSMNIVESTYSEIFETLKKNKKKIESEIKF